MWAPCCSPRRRTSRSSPSSARNVWSVAETSVPTLPPPPQRPLAGSGWGTPESLGEGGGHGTAGVLLRARPPASLALVCAALALLPGCRPAGPGAASPSCWRTRECHSLGLPRSSGPRPCPCSRFKLYSRPQGNFSSCIGCLISEQDPSTGLASLPTSGSGLSSLTMLDVLRSG